MSIDSKLLVVIFQVGTMDVESTVNLAYDIQRLNNIILYVGDPSVNFYIVFEVTDVQIESNSYQLCQ